MTPDQVESQKKLIEEQRATLKQKMGELRQEFQTKAKAFFSDATKSLFEQFPTLENFAWTQGQEYNDEGYEFYVRNYSDSIEINGKREDDQEGRGTYEIKQDIKKFADRPAILVELQKELDTAQAVEDAREELASAVSKVLGMFESDDYEMMFGDGYKITINRDGSVDVETYDY